MAVDRDVAGELVTDRSRAGGGPDATPPPKRPLSRRARIWIAVVAAALLGWFFLAWLVLGQNVIDAAGESVGSALLLLVVVSVVAAVRDRRINRPGPPR